MAAIWIWILWYIKLPKSEKIIFFGHRRFCNHRIRLSIWDRTPRSPRSTGEWKVLASALCGARRRSYKASTLLLLELVGDDVDVLQILPQNPPLIGFPDLQHQISTPAAALKGRRGLNFDRKWFVCGTLFFRKLWFQVGFLSNCTPWWLW